jgi:uncharacterized protein (TIGR02145 family)
MKILPAFIIAFYVLSEMLFAQNTINIHTSQGPVNTFSLSQIDSIYFTYETPSSNVTDIDGNIYKTVTIGTQVWFSENLRTTRYRNGDLIVTTIPVTKDILSEVTPKYQWAVNGDQSMVSVYGLLYTGYVVTDGRKLCPIGYHVPSDAEWRSLIDFLGGFTIAGGKMKEAGNNHWITPNTGADNSSGFLALPAGSRAAFGAFNDIGMVGWWWSYSDYITGLGLFINLPYNVSEVNRNLNSKYIAYSVRCVRD